MKRFTMRKRWVAVAALSLALTGCAGTPMAAWLGGAPAPQAQRAQVGSLKVRVQGAYRPQTLSEGTLIVLRLETFEGDGPEPRRQELTLTAAGEATFTDLLPGWAHLTASLVRSGRVIDQQREELQIQPGDNAVTFALQDGSSALDLALGYDARVQRKDVASTPGFEAMPRLGVEETRSFELRLATGATHSVDFRNDFGFARRVDDGYWMHMEGGSGPGPQGDPLTLVPEHAVMVPEATPSWPAENPRVRTWTWSNDYPDPADPQRLRTLHFERWYSPEHGLLREDVHEASASERVFVSTLILKGW